MNVSKFSNTRTRGYKKNPKTKQQNYQDSVQNKSKYFIWCAAKPQNFLKDFVLDVKQVPMVIM